MGDAMRWMIILAMVVMSGCATSPGKLTKNDLSWHTYSISAALSKVYDGLQENSRYCGGLIGQYSPEWYPAQDMESAKIDLFLRTAFGGASEWAAGVIDLKRDGDKTIATVGIQKQYSNPIFKKDGWWKERFSNIVKEIEDSEDPSCD